MQPFHALVKNGRLTLDEPSEMPDGHVVLLLPLEELLTLVDDYSDKGGIAFSYAPEPRSFRKPKTVDASTILDELRSM